MAAADSPAEPADAGSSTPRTQPPIFPDDYDLSDQPHQAATEPPEPPAEPEPGLFAAPMSVSQRAAEELVMRQRAEVGDELKEDKAPRGRAVATAAKAKAAERKATKE